jgi:hypothetical protein
MSTGLFADEEDGYNSLEEDVETIEETKFKLKVPSSEPMADDSIEGLEDFGGEDAGAEDLGDFGGEEMPADDKPFDDEPFEAGVEADEESDPKTYIQQLSGKLGQSLRTYSDEQGQPDFDLEKFAVNSVLSATHTGEMDDNDQSDIIKKVKSSGNGDGDIDVNVDVDAGGDEELGDVSVDGDEATPEGDMDFGDEEMEENVELDIPRHNPNDYGVDDLKRYYDADITRTRDGLRGKVVRFGDGKLKIKVTGGPQVGSIFYASPSEIEIDSADFNLGEGKTPTETLDNSEKKRNFVGKYKIMENRTEVEPTTKPTTKPAVKPDVKPTRRQRPFRPTIQPKVEPKATTDDGVISEGGGSHGKIIETKFVDSNIAIIKVALNDKEVDIKFENTGEYVDKPLAYDEPWVYTYESVKSPDDKTYTVGVEFFGHPEQNLDLSGITDDYIEEA